MLEQLKKYEEFRERYFETLKFRFAFASLDMEEITTGDYADPVQAMKIYNQLEALNFMFANIDATELHHYEFTQMLTELITKVTGGELCKFRTTEAQVVGSKIKRSEARNIVMDLWYLIDDYNYQMANCDSEERFFEIEAQTHIRFLHIHPFEDGNGRVARIFSAYNLLKNDKAPAVISREYKTEYCDYIERGDVKSLAKMFQMFSKAEAVTMRSIYNDLEEKGLLQEQPRM